MAGTLSAGEVWWQTERGVFKRKERRKAGRLNPKFVRRTKKGNKRVQELNRDFLPRILTGTGQLLYQDLAPFHCRKPSRKYAEMRIRFPLQPPVSTCIF